jgi:hypothetical protein
VKRVTEKLSITITPWILAEIDKRDVGRGRSETISRLIRRCVMLLSHPATGAQQALADAVEADKADQREAKEHPNNE